MTAVLALRLDSFNTAGRNDLRTCYDMLASRFLLAASLTILALAACASPISEETSHDEGAINATPSPPNETCGLGWGADPDSFDGVEGQYERRSVAAPNDLMTVSIINWAEATAHISSEADAVMTFACSAAQCPSEQARASLLPSNAATNPMIMFSADGFDHPNPDLRGVYNVLGIERAPDGTIAAMCLYDLASGPTGAAFVLRRAP